MTQIITLYATGPALEFDTVIHWNENRKCLVKKKILNSFFILSFLYYLLSFCFDNSKKNDYLNFHLTYTFPYPQKNNDLPRLES